MDISKLAGVGPGRAKLLREMGIATILDLVNYFPRDYDDRSEIKTISMLTPGTTHTIRGIIASEGENITFRPGTPVMTKLMLEDETGLLELIWFGQPYLKRNFKKHETYLFTGRVVESYGRLQMESPDYEKIPANFSAHSDGSQPETLSAGRIVPIYTLPKGISQKMFRKWMKAALDSLEITEEEDPLPEFAPKDLCTRQQAIENIHFPASDEHFHAARRRLVFEELFFMQLALLKIKKAAQPGIKITNTDLSPFLAQLPFTLTEAQQSVLAEITEDLQKGRRMNRLIQGDVGSGKTVVAAAAAYLVIAAGYQAAIMAPTEVLARQHYKHFSNYFRNFKINNHMSATKKMITGTEMETVLLIGSLTAKEKKAAHTAIREGHAKMVVGTHALIQESVEFHNLALVITDEQHRFGVNQRASLLEKGYSKQSPSSSLSPKSSLPGPHGQAVGNTKPDRVRNVNDMPHTMVMTATPIPRTLGLILYGDMDISIINALPPGRQEIKTYRVNSGYRARLHAFIAKQVQEGRQVYVICPAIDESEMDMHSVTAYTAELQKALPDIPIACLHGRLKDKESIMAAFSRNEYPIIVSTTVIEVGVDVANATLIVIENAERFGLSQLHQLRGRVGRGAHQSYCVLVTDSKAEHTIERMRAMESTSDGFVLSELDLKQRGPGDFFGVQQHGLPVFAIANLYRDMDILKEAQKAAIKASQGQWELDVGDVVM